MALVSLGPQSRRSSPRWHEWLAGIVLLLVTLGFLVVRPAAQNLLQGLSQGFNQVVGTAMTQTASLLTQTYALACLKVEQDIAVQTLFGGQITCSPIEDVKWLRSPDAHSLVFEFSIQSESGLQGTAVATAHLQNDRLRIESILVAGDNGALMVTPLP